MSTIDDRRVGRMTFRRGPEEARAAVLFLHGGQVRGTTPVSRRSGSIWRMSTVRDALTPDLTERGAASWMLRYGQRGWNGVERSPVADVEWALAEIKARDGDVPVVLVGHSMGARAGAAAVGAANVLGLVALAPWFDKDDPIDGFADRRLIAGHGTRDRITSPRATHAFVHRVRDSGIAREASVTDLDGLGHYLISGADRWQEFARRATLAILEGRAF